jgi:hypothetical protein
MKHTARLVHSANLTVLKKHRRDETHQDSYTLFDTFCTLRARKALMELYY